MQLNKWGLERVEEIRSKKKWGVGEDYAGPIGQCKKNSGKPLWSLGCRGDMSQSGLAAVMFRTEHRREASAESETPKVQYYIYLGNRWWPSLKELSMEEE